MAINIEYLTGLGIEKEIADKIFAERGKEIELAKKQAEQTEKKLSEAEIKVGNLTNELKNMQTNFEGKTAEEWKKELDTTLQNIELEKQEREKADELARQDGLLRARFEKELGDNEFELDIVARALYSDFKAQIEDPNNTGKGDKEIFESLTADKGYFKSKHPSVEMPRATPGEQTKTTEFKTFF